MVRLLSLSCIESSYLSNVCLEYIHKEGQRYTAERDNLNVVNLTNFIDLIRFILRLPMILVKSFNEPESKQFKRKVKKVSTKWMLHVLTY